METKRIVAFALLFAVLSSFSALSLGLTRVQYGVIDAVAKQDSIDSAEGRKIVHFDEKVLRFLKRQIVCSITDEQASALEGMYETETKIFDVKGKSVDVLYVYGKGLTKRNIEKRLGISLGKKCQIVHGNKVIALLVTPIFVS